MANNFTVAPCSSLSKANDYTSQIHTIFIQHWNTLENDRQANIDRIDTWLRDSKERIKKYADKQKVLINDHYNRLRPTFDEQYEGNLDIANEYYDAKEANLFKDLYKECQLLKFQVAKLTDVIYEFEQPAVTILKEQTKTSETRNDARPRRRRNNKNKNENEDISATSANLPSDSIASNSKQIDDQKIPETKAKKNGNPKKSTTNDSNSQETNIDESNNECPTCYMIFSPYASTKDCRQHVNEHYAYD